MDTHICTLKDVDWSWTLQGCKIDINILVFLDLKITYFQLIMVFEKAKLFFLIPLHNVLETLDYVGFLLWIDYKQVENYKTRQVLLIHQLVLICWRVVPQTISFYNPKPYQSQNILGHDIAKSIPKYPRPWYCQKYPKIS